MNQEKAKGKTMKVECDIYRYVADIRKADPDVHVKSISIKSRTPWANRGFGSDAETIDLEIVFSSTDTKESICGICGLTTGSEKAQLCPRCRRDR